MIRWLEGSAPVSQGFRYATYAADTPLGRATVKAVRYRHKGLVAWRGRLADLPEIERATARECMEQLEAMIILRQQRRNQHEQANRDRDHDPERPPETRGA